MNKRNKLRLMLITTLERVLSPTVLLLVSPSAAPSHTGGAGHVPTVRACAPSFTIFPPTSYLLVICHELFRLVLLSAPFVHAVTFFSFVSPLLARHRNTIEVPPMLRLVSPCFICSHWHSQSADSANGSCLLQGTVNEAHRMAIQQAVSIGRTTQRSCAE